MSEKTLVIVESPSKAKTINKYLGKDYIISSSMGHIIDLPKSRLAIDIENNFNPEYITIRGKAKILNDLKKKAKTAKMVLLATDPDREGEAISWHLHNSLSKNCPNIKRIEFNEITESAIKEAVKHPRDINIELVNAQQARRVLDRIVGYFISPILWRKVKKGLSAGRVQSVALKVICERENEIDAFVPEEYWDISADLKAGNAAMNAALYAKNGEKLKITGKEAADKTKEDLEKAKYIVESVNTKDRKRNPLPPYITSKLQQDAANRLGFTSSKTMMVAQQLYEGIPLGTEGPVGLITYMRTDSLRISETAINAVRQFISDKYSPEYLPASPNQYQNKKGAQDAHEAIRPSDVLRDPEKIKDYLTKDQYKLYSLIWKRFVSSQMTPEKSELISAVIKADEYELRASASKTVFDGFTVLEKEEKSKKNTLPKISEGDILALEKINSEQHFTSPPPRFNDASLVKFLEESGIGRPSTYAPTINTLIKRYYIVRSGRQLVPTVLGKLVNGLIIENFKDLVSVDFTAEMEAKLDGVEEKKYEWHSMISDFFTPFSKTVEKAEKQIADHKGSLDEKTDEVCEKCGKPMLKKLGKFGYFLACSGFPECRNSKSLPLGKCPKDNCDGSVVKRSSKKGRPFYSCSNYPDCDFITREIPSDKPCPKCGKLLFSKRIKNKGVKLSCLNEKCGYTLEISDGD
ncbi:MAG TPA: type I DNA topoisomerase [Spirochaetota bacterium]|nr:type I DNA topoisomerase [Spirochaetota bacterium]HOR43372.1 type I DNA topoisomerase [Spirochaetota bacterium]HOU84833.1 type I DNA topoisomerase [Spirochaetota bacterium]HPK54879.1 type I DNA topoisomerase [Spirochaetota bacterium]HQE59227.1 type I DNA topoisomerase [Spirochaetota bacterium]